MHFRSGNARPHVVDLLLRVTFFNQLCIRVGIALRCLCRRGTGHCTAALCQLQRVVPCCIPCLSAGHQAQQLLLPVVALYILLQLLPVAAGRCCILCALYAGLTRQKNRGCHRVSNTANGIGRAPRCTLSCRQRIKVGNVLPRFADLLAAVSLCQQFRIGVVPSARTLFRHCCAGCSTAHALGLHGVVFLGIALSAGANAHQRHKFPVLRVSVHPLVQPVKIAEVVCRFQIFRVLLHLLRSLCIPAFISAGNACNALALSGLHRSRHLCRRSCSALRVQPFRLRSAAACTCTAVGHNAAFARICLCSACFLRHCQLQLVAGVLPCSRSRAGSILSAAFRFPAFPRFCMLRTHLLLSTPISDC